MPIWLRVPWFSQTYKFIESCNSVGFLTIEYISLQAGFINDYLQDVHRRNYWKSFFRIHKFMFTKGTNLTRMHSSRMRTARFLPISPSMHCSEGGVPGPRGCTWSRGYQPGGGVPAGGCTCPGVYLVLGGAPAQGVPVRGCTCLGVYLVLGGTCPGTPPPVDRQTRVKT